MNKISFITGGARLYTEESSKEALLDHFLRNGIRAKCFCQTEKDGLYCDIPINAVKKIAPSLDKLNIIVYIINIWGLKVFLNRFFKRTGLVIGALLFCVMLWASTFFVWRIEIKGDTAHSKEVFGEFLLANGVYEGAFIGSIDRVAVANDLVARYPEISWAAINLRGTTLVLEVMDTVLPEGQQKQSSDIVIAKSDGVIKGLEIYSGRPSVSPGEVVKKGDMLIAGYISGNGLQYTEQPLLRYEGARGRVFADVTQALDAFAPYEKEELCITSKHVVGAAVELFGKQILIGGEGDTGSEKKKITVFGVAELPVSYKVYHRHVTETKKVCLSAEQARLSAERQIYAKIREACQDGEISSLKIRFEEREDGVSARATVSYVTDIAEPKDLK